MYTGGGILEMHVGGTLEVSGYIQANALDVNTTTSYSGGGSGGSILIFTTNFTG